MTFKVYLTRRQNNGSCRRGSCGAMGPSIFHISWEIAYSKAYCMLFDTKEDLILSY